MSVLVTSGPTRAYFDRIRYIANTSSGVLGAHIVESLTEQGIHVIHLYGKGSKTPNIHNHSLVKSLQVITVNDVIESIKTASTERNVSAVVHAMAVLDYVPESSIGAKKRSGDEFWNIRLVRTPKVLTIIRELFPEAYTIGFKLEVGVSEEQLIKQAGALLNSYGIEMVVANDIDSVSDNSHEALFIGPGNEILARVVTKKEIATKVTECIIEHVNKMQ